MSFTFTLLRCRAGSTPTSFTRDCVSMLAAELAGLLCCRMVSLPALFIWNGVFHADDMLCQVVLFHFSVGDRVRSFESEMRTRECERWRFGKWRFTRVLFRRGKEREKGEKLASVQQTLPLKVKYASQVALTL